MRDLMLLLTVLDREFLVGALSVSIHTKRQTSWTSGSIPLLPGALRAVIDRWESLCAALLATLHDRGDPNGSETSFAGQQIPLVPLCYLRGSDVCYVSCATLRDSVLAIRDDEDFTCRIRTAGRAMRMATAFAPRALEA